MQKTISRRTFLKKSAAMAGTLAVAGTADARPAEQKTRPLATLIDISKCVGCEECVEACATANGHKYPKPAKPFPEMVPKRVRVEDWSDKQSVSDRLTPYNWLFIQRAAVRIDGEEDEISIPRRCMHCVNPPCVKLCPWGAAKQLNNGISRLDPDLCLGGSKCKSVCPWDIPQRQTGVGLYLDLLPRYAGNGVMFKCDRCYDRIAAGETPACIEVCPEEVQVIGHRDEILRMAYERAREINGYVYGDKENGGTNTFYVSPVPFETLNRTIESGPGMPHLEPVADVMADANNLAAALFIAPIAGLATAVGRFYGGAKKIKEANHETA